MPSPLYETSDHYLASFLLSQGVTLSEVVRVGKRRTVFRFAATEATHELLRQYWRQQEMRLIPLRLFTAHQRIKSIIRGSHKQYGQP
jgi:hypothetical protein